MLAGCALAVALAAWVLKAPGAWGAAACWGLMCASQKLWGWAQSIDATARSESKRSEQAYAEGQGQRARVQGVSTFKKGAMISMGSVIVSMGGLLALIGTFALSAAWGVLTMVPMVCLGIVEYRKWAKESDQTHGESHE